MKSLFPSPVKFAARHSGEALFPPLADRIIRVAARINGRSQLIFDEPVAILTVEKTCSEDFVRPQSIRHDQHSITIKSITPRANRSRLTAQSVLRHCTNLKDQLTKRRKVTDYRLEQMCPHGEETPFDCRVCDGKLAERKISPTVYVTSYGEYYHCRRDCTRLIYGQQMVENRGGTPSPIEAVSEDSAKLDKIPCNQCKPKKK
jgi:hypothetical protein